MATRLRTPTRAAWLGIWLLATTLIAGPIPFARAAASGDGCVRPCAGAPERHEAAGAPDDEGCAGASSADVCRPGCADCGCCPSALLAILPVLPPVGGAPWVEALPPTSPDPPDTGIRDRLERPPRA